MLGFYCRWLAERRAKNERRELERREARRRKSFARSEQELVFISRRSLAKNMPRCVDGPAFEEEFDLDDAHVELKSVINPKGKKLTRIKVTSDRIGLVVVELFSYRARRIYQETRTIYAS